MGYLAVGVWPVGMSQGPCRWPFVGHAGPAGWHVDAVGIVGAGPFPSFPLQVVHF